MSARACWCLRIAVAVALPIAVFGGCASTPRDTPPATRPAVPPGPTPAEKSQLHRMLRGRPAASLDGPPLTPPSMALFHERDRCTTH